jgi:hypothetical protein
VDPLLRWEAAITRPRQLGVQPTLSSDDQLESARQGRVKRLHHGLSCSPENRDSLALSASFFARFRKAQGTAVRPGICCRPLPGYTAEAGGISRQAVSLTTRTNSLIVRMFYDTGPGELER